MKAAILIAFLLFELCPIFNGGLQAAEKVNFFGLYGVCRNTPEETREYVRNCKEAGITVLIPSVSGGGGAIWKTTTEYYYPPLKQALDSGYDALAELIKVAHENGIKVMPSVAVGAMNKLAREHPEWVTLDRNGEPSTKTGPTSVAFSYPGARAWKVQGIMDLVTGYDVDGVVLDYCRYPEHTTTQETSYGFYGYDGPLVSVCEQTYGFNPKTEPINSPNWNIFNRLRKESVTAFVAELREAIRQSGRNVTLIGFGDTDPEMDANMAGRESAAWARRGLIDAYLAGTYLDPVDKMGETVESIRKAIGPNTKVYTAITPYGDRVTTEAEMLAMAKVQLAAGTDGLWIYRDDFFEKHNLWKAAATTTEVLTVATAQGVAWKGSAAPLISYDAAAAGVGVTPTAVTPEWTFSGGGYPQMVNNGTFLLQSGSPGTYGEYASPSAGAGTMVYRSSTYGIAFRVEPLTDVPFVGSDWPNLYVGWADDTYFYNVTIDKYSGEATSGTGDIVYGKGSFSPAITGIDWSVPHDIYIGVRGPAGEYGEFDFYLDGVFKGTVSGGSIARDRAGWEFLENKVIFGDGTTGGTDVEAQWYSIGIFGSAAPVPPAPSGLSYTPDSQTGSVGTAIVSMAPTVTGIVTNYSVSPALPPGLGIDAATGVISGTPTAVSAAGTYTVTASNTGGSTAAEVAIGVQSGSYAAWAQGAPLDAANQLKYAIGGASSPTATNGVAPVTTVNSSLLSITAIVRTDDPSLTVYGQSILNLASGTWITNDVSMNPSVDQAGVPAGTQRQVFSTPRASNDAKKFLRLKTIL